MNKQIDPAETYALIAHSDKTGRTRLARVEVLDWNDDGEPMVAERQGFLTSAFELPGYQCLTGAGVVPTQTPRGPSLGSGMARAALDRGERVR